MGFVVLCNDPIYVFDVIARHGWFVAMEYIERSLGDVIAAIPPLDLVRRAKLAIDTARGFEFLHNSGVYHRDISPDCILVALPLEGSVTRD